MCGAQGLGLLASIGTDCTVRLWDLRSKRMSAQHRLWERTPKGVVRTLSPICADMSSDAAAHLCVGLTNGSCRVYSCSSGMSLFATIVGEDAGGGGGGGGGRRAEVRVTCVRYSTDDSMLAVAASDSTITIYFKGATAYER